MVDFFFFSPTSETGGTLTFVGEQIASVLEPELEAGQRTGQSAEAAAVVGVAAEVVRKRTLLQVAALWWQRVVALRLERQTQWSQWSAGSEQIPVQHHLQHQTPSPSYVEIQQK